MNIYKKFASVYDTMGADKFSVSMFNYCLKLFKQHNINPTSILDLCCGTGTAVKNFSDKGYKIAGLDQSLSMLAVAKKKIKKKNVIFYHKELPKFRLIDNRTGKQAKFDLVTSFYDSLNYMTTETKLKTAFKSVADHLVLDGHFIFDMNTPEALKTIWDENIYSGLKDDMAWIWRNEYDKSKKQAACYATFFKKKGKLWERFDETHIEQAYNNSTIKRLLKESGFKILGFYQCLTFEKPDRNSYRICAVAQKR